MSYYRLGNNCMQSTIAITSNQKFLLPLDSIYHKKYTKNVLLYPGHEEDNTLNKNNKPNLIDTLKSRIKENKTCKTCS